MNYGKAINRIRMHLKDNQEGFSLNVGISQSHLSAVEAGNKNPSPKLLARISDYSQFPLPIIAWMAIEESDIPQHKKKAFATIKQRVDEFLKDFS